MAGRQALTLFLSLSKKLDIDTFGLDIIADDTEVSSGRYLLDTNVMTVMIWFYDLYPDHTSCLW